MAESTVAKLPHHEQEELCRNRPAYRQGRKLTAVKVYTINNESRHLIVAGVPKLQLRDQVKKMFSQYGHVKRIYALDSYPSEEFEEAFHVHFERIQSARIAKHFNDGKNFYGGLLHVFYAPELETIVETREKLAQRRKDVFTRIERHKQDPVDPRLDPFIPLPTEQQQRKKKHPARLPSDLPPDPEPPSIIEPIAGPSEFLLQAPYQQTESIFREAGVHFQDPPNILQKRKNYKGRTIYENSRSKTFKPSIVDTTTLLAKIPPVVLPKNEEPKSQFVNVRKVDRGITIRVPSTDEKVKRIVLKSNECCQLVKPSGDLEASIRTAKSQIRESMLKRVKDQQVDK